MQITTLIENHTADPDSDLTAEHGLSLHIRHEDKQILFDTGATGAFADNALQLGVDLSHVDAVVLSHHHHDHGGGLATFFEANDHAKVYLRRPPEGQPYFRALLFISRYIGLPDGLLEAHQDRFVFVDAFAEILPGVFIFTDIGRQHALPKGNRYIYLKDASGYVHDQFEHELILATRTAEGLMIVTGCSHSGTLNMIQTVRDQLPDEPIKGVVGGFHLIGLPMYNSMAGSKSEITAMGHKLRDLPIEQYWTGHCTGQKGYDVLNDVLGDRLAKINTGTRIEID